MVSAAKAFASEPPREPLTSLKAIKRDFKWRYVKRQKTDQVIKFCKDAPDFATAVRRAVEARDANGKHHNHQSKVDLNSRRRFGAKIVGSKKMLMREIRTAKAERVEWYTEFDAMYDWFDALKPMGIGPVTVYDVAVRVGAYLGCEPESVYLHAGVKQGLKALEAALERSIDNPEVKSTSPHDLLGAHKLKRVPMYLFPEPFDGCKADDVEDMLCTYREVFESW